VHSRRRLGHVPGGRLTWTLRAEHVPSRIHALQGDITLLDVDVIVNAANSTLLGGGGVDGAIHDAAGPELLRECRGLGGCPTGEVRITQAYRLKARRIIHAVGPIWRGGMSGEREQLAACYEQALHIACSHELRSIAFPSISTGAYGFPIALAAPIAVRAVHGFVERSDLVAEVIFCCFSSHDLSVYRRVLGSVRA
jgi:O-acetyl-ADP-ribose deacetylase